MNVDPKCCVRKGWKSSALCCKWRCYKQLCVIYYHLPLFQNTPVFWWYCLDNLLNNWLDTAACQHQERLNHINNKTNKKTDDPLWTCLQWKSQSNHHKTKTWRWGNLLSSKVLGCLLQMGFLLNEGRDRQTQSNETSGTLKTPKF